MPRLCRLINARRPRAPVTVQGVGATTIRQVSVAYRRDGTAGARVTQRRVPESLRIPPGSKLDGLPESYGQLADVQRQVRLRWLRVEYYEAPEPAIRSTSAPPNQPSIRGQRQGNKKR